jgi:hypothetical protein
MSNIVENRKLCECPRCGRNHWKLGNPPGHSALPEDVRIPLHELQADVDYLIGRVVADGSCGPMIAASIKDKLAKIEASLVEVKP